MLTPAVVESATGEAGVVDSAAGTVHLTIGVGGNPTAPTPESFARPPGGRVVCGVERPAEGRPRPSVKVSEPAEWLAARCDEHPFGFTLFDVDPGAPGGSTRITATHYGARRRSATYEPVDRFTLERPRGDALLVRNGSRPGRRQTA